MWTAIPKVVKLQRWSVPCQSAGGSSACVRFLPLTRLAWRLENCYGISNNDIHGGKSGPPVDQ